MHVKKINIVVGGRFQSAQIYHSLTSCGFDVMLYASSPKKYFKTVPNDRIVFVPKVIQIFQKLLNRRMPRFLHEINAVLFDWLISKIMRPADLLWGFNGDSLYCGISTKKNGGLYVVDRACPHFETQEELLAGEGAKIGYPFARFSRRARKRYIREYAEADAIVVTSSYSKRSFLEKGFPKSKMHVILLDSNIPQSSSTGSFMDESIGKSEKTEFRVGLVGGSFLRKGIIYLLRAVKILDNPNIVLYIRAPQANVIQHPEAKLLCDELGVVFVPYVEDINRFYRSLDVFVLPSIDEGFGMVVYEALMNSTPVLASSNVGAIDGLVPDKEIVIFPAGDEMELSKKLDRLYHDNQFRFSVGKAGREFYMESIKNGNRHEDKMREFMAQLHKTIQ